MQLNGHRVSYRLDSRDGNLPKCRYWGGLLAPPEFSESPLPALPIPPGAELDQPVELSIFPEEGFGFWGQPALRGHRDQRHWATRFVTTGERAIDNGHHLQFEDKQAQLGLELEFHMDPESDVLKRRTRLANIGDTPYQVQWCAAAAFELPAFCTDLLTFHGAWLKEFTVRHQPFPQWVYLRENRRGRTSHDGFPGLIVGSGGFNETEGTVFGFTLGWSGNHRLLAETLSNGEKQVQFGELLMPGQLILEPGRTYCSPWVYACWSDQGLNDLSQKFHDFMRRRILHPLVCNRPRPVQFNSWEAIYFHHEATKLEQLVDQTAALGVERFVLDDGWFVNRPHERSGLGDWTPDPEKYPQGLRPLIERVLSAGMSFGLWIEPEMVNPDSHLYRNHPDWVLHLDPAPRQTGRHQLVLNLALAPVQEYLFESLHRLLKQHSISYLKWDMNRDLTGAGHQGRAAFGDQTRALYKLLDRLREAHPQVEVESCASGGGRIDYEILKRTDRFWTSDNNDALNRLTIQRGASLFFPLEIMGNHVGPSPSHTTGRSLPLDFRAHVALFGNLGLECDLTQLEAREIRHLKQHIKCYKKWRHLIHKGRFYRLAPPDPHRCGHGVVAEDGSRALFALFQMELPLPARSRRVSLLGLERERRYRVKMVPPLTPEIINRLSDHGVWLEKGYCFSGEMLANEGLDICLSKPQTSLLLAVEAI